MAVFNCLNNVHPLIITISTHANLPNNELRSIAEAVLGVPERKFFMLFTEQIWPSPK